MNKEIDKYTIFLLVINIYLSLISLGAGEGALEIINAKNGLTGASNLALLVFILMNIAVNIIISVTLLIIFKKLFNKKIIANINEIKSNLKYIYIVSILMMLINSAITDNFMKLIPGIIIYVICSIPNLVVLKKQFQNKEKKYKNIDKN